MAILLLVVFFVFLRVRVYSQKGFINSDWVNLLELIIPFLSLVYLFLFFYFSYSLYNYYFYYSKTYWNLELIGHFVAYTLLIFCVFLLLPGLLFLNSMLVLTDVFLYNSYEILQTVPSMKFSDFFGLCMEGKQPGFGSTPNGRSYYCCGKTYGKGICLF